MKANRGIDRIRSRFTVTLTNTVRAPYTVCANKANRRSARSPASACATSGRLLGARTTAAIDRRLQRAKLVLFELGKAREPAFADLRLDFAAPLQLRLPFELA